MPLPGAEHITTTSLRSVNSKLFLNLPPCESKIMIVNLKMPLAAVIWIFFNNILKTFLMVGTHAVRNNSPLCNKRYTHFVQSFLQCFSPFQKLLSQDRLKVEPPYHSLSVAVKSSLFFSLVSPAFFFLNFIFQTKSVQDANCDQNIIISQETQPNSRTAFAALLTPPVWPFWASASLQNSRHPLPRASADATG